MVSSGPKEARIRWGAHWCHLVNTTEPSKCNAALCQITLTTCYHCHCGCHNPHRCWLHHKWDRATAETRKPTSNRNSPLLRANFRCTLRDSADVWSRCFALTSNAQNKWQQNHTNHVLCTATLIHTVPTNSLIWNSLLTRLFVQTRNLTNKNRLDISIESTFSNSHFLFSYSVLYSELCNTPVDSFCN